MSDDFIRQRFLRKNGLIPPLPTKKEQKPIKKVSEKKSQQVKQEKKNNSNEDLEMFYDMVAEIIAKNPKCWETGDTISPADYRNATSHIFPKNIFKSIRSHPLNYLILSPRNGSHDKTHRLDTFSKMFIWPVAVARFRQFEPFIKEKHKYLDEFRKLAEEYEAMIKTKPGI